MKKGSNKKSNSNILFSEAGTMYRECVLFPHAVKGKRDSSKPWSISYYVYNVAKKSLERKLLKKYNNIKDPKQREILCLGLMEKINNLLKKGYLFDPEKIDEPNKNTHENSEKIGVYIQQYLNQKYTENLSENTIYFLKYVFEIVDNFLLIHNLQNIKPEHFTNQIGQTFRFWLMDKNGKNFKPHHTKNIIAKTSGFFNWYKQNYNHDFILPFANIKIKTTQTNRNTGFTDKQIEVLWAEMEKRLDFDMLIFTKIMYYTFLRPQKEIRLLKHGNIRDNHIWIDGSMNKNRRNKSVMVPKALMAVFERFEFDKQEQDKHIFTKRNGQVFSKKYFYMMFVERYRHLLQPGQTLYSFKASGNTKLFEKYGDLSLNRRQNGHSSEKTTLIYIKKHSPVIDERLLDF